ARTNTNVATINVGGQPGGLAFSPDGTRLYVASAYAMTGGVSVIDPCTNTVLALIPVPYAQGVAVTPDGAQVYVTQPNMSRVAVIDTAAKTVVASLPIGWIPMAVASSADGARAFIPP